MIGKIVKWGLVFTVLYVLVKRFVSRDDGKQMSREPSFENPTMEPIQVYAAGKTDDGGGDKDDSR